MRENDTICAISTPPGQGAIAVIRLSGNNAINIADKVFHFSNNSKSLKDHNANTLHHGKIIYKEKEWDDVIAGLFKTPNSYTGEDIVEISCHGSLFVQQKILELLVDAGARLARPGEFTQRAFLNGKLDLSQAEGVADLIACSSEAAHRLAYKQMRGGFSQEINKLRNELLQFISLIELELDFSEEDVEFADRKKLTDLVQRISKLISDLIHSFEYGNSMKNGIPVAIIGNTNSGKSTLLNRLLRDDKAIVSEIPGTTRDSIEDVMVLKGILFRFIDTAGLRHTTDVIEKEGIQRTIKKYNQASFVIVLIDITDAPAKIDESLQFIRNEYKKNRKIIFALNKSDKLSQTKVKERIVYYKEKWSDIAHIIEISAKKDIHIDVLEQLLFDLTVKETPGENEVVVTNVRHFEALKHAAQALNRADNGIRNSLPGDLLAQDIREVLHYLGNITGEITTDEILGNIFKNFCIGK